MCIVSLICVSLAGSCCCGSERAQQEKERRKRHIQRERELRIRNPSCWEQTKRIFSGQSSGRINKRERRENNARFRKQLKREREQEMKEARRR
jgi:hypothetical protein